MCCCCGRVRKVKTMLKPQTRKKLKQLITEKKKTLIPNGKTCWLEQNKAAQRRVLFSHFSKSVTTRTFCVWVQFPSKLSQKDYLQVILCVIKRLILSPYLSAFRTPAHVAADTGGIKRSDPVGGEAYGIPLNTSTGSKLRASSCTIVPDTAPFFV